MTPQNLHLHLLQIIPLRRIHLPVRLIALIIRALLPVIPPLLATALPATTAHAQQQRDQNHTAADCDPDDSGPRQCHLASSRDDAGHGRCGIAGPG
jgi:hypothetical protein